MISKHIWGCLWVCRHKRLTFSFPAALRSTQSPRMWSKHQWHPGSQFITAMLTCRTSSSKSHFSCLLTLNSARGLLNCNVLLPFDFQLYPCSICACVCTCMEARGQCWLSPSVALILELIDKTRLVGPWALGIHLFVSATQMLGLQRLWPSFYEDAQGLNSVLCACTEWAISPAFLWILSGFLKVLSHPMT